METRTLFEEFRLVEKCETEINGAWKGAHLLLFCLAFVFGSFCTFCFHMLMYLFDEKCVLFPKLLSLTSLRHNVIYELIPEDKEISDITLPVDFVSTQWVEQSACYLPTYVPLISGIFGLVWTTMFLMCSTGSRTLTGLQRPWRVIPPVFVFSLVMSGLCIYSSAVTHYGLQELCAKLGEITGSTTCTYTINVATLAYERRIRGVYQATRLTIISAWFHTFCWLLSAILALVRMLLAVDFQLVRVRVRLIGDTDRMLERYEKQLRTVSPNLNTDDECTTELHHLHSYASTMVNFKKKSYDSDSFDSVEMNTEDVAPVNELLYISKPPHHESEFPLLPGCQKKLIIKQTQNEAIQSDIKQFLNDLINNLPPFSRMPLVKLDQSSSARANDSIGSATRRYGQAALIPKENLYRLRETEEIVADLIKNLEERMYRELPDSSELIAYIKSSEDRSVPSTSDRRHMRFESTLNVTEEFKQKLGISEKTESNKNNRTVKSNLKTVGIQTETVKRRKRTNQKVKISDSVNPQTEYSSENSDSDTKDKNTQTFPKEKQE